MVTFLLLLLAGMTISQTTESNDGDYSEWVIVGDFNEPLNGTAEPYEDQQDFIDADDPPVLSDEMCYEMLMTLDEQQQMPLSPDALNDNTLDQPSRFYGSGPHGNRYWPNRQGYGNRYWSNRQGYGNRYWPNRHGYNNRYSQNYNGPYGSYGNCFRTRGYRSNSGTLCYGRRRVTYGPYTYCCQANYLRPFVSRRGRSVRCRCY